MKLVKPKDKVQMMRKTKCKDHPPRTAWKHNCTQCWVELLEDAKAVGVKEGREHSNQRWKKTLLEAIYSET